MRSHRRLLTVSALTLASVLAGQDRELPRLDDAAPLSHPRAPGALRGLTVCLAPIAGGADSDALRTTTYLARLLEGAGARVAQARFAVDDGEPAESAPDVARAAAAGLLLEISWGSGGAAELRLPRRPKRDRVAELEDALADLLIGERFGRGDFDHASYGSARRVSRDDRPPLPRIQLRLRADTDSALAHRAPTHDLFEAIVTWWRGDRERIRGLQAALAAAPNSRPRSLNPLWPVERPPRTEAEVAAILDSWQRTRIVDPTQVYLRVEVHARDGGWELSGATEFPLLAVAVRRLLASVGVEPLAGELRILPDEERIGGPAYGVVRSRAALTWRRPGRATGLARIDPQGQFEETQLLRGEPVRVLDRADGYLLVHALSGYLGWAREGAVERCGQERFRVALAEATGGTDDAGGERAAREALARLGTPYLFGGRSAEGIDCSGLAQTSWASQRTFLPRDTRMQVLCGQLVATARQPAPLEPGDLLFFTNSSGRISHVAISLGGWRFVHATPPEVTVGSLDREDPWYANVAERFVLAKRVAR